MYNPAGRPASLGNKKSPFMAAKALPAKWLVFRASACLAVRTRMPAAQERGRSTSTMWICHGPSGK